MKKHIVLFFFVIGLIFSSQSQLTLMDPDYNQANPLNCAGIIPPPPSGTNFIEGVGNYLPNMNETIVFCPDLTQGSKVSIAFATNIGFEFNIDPTDTLYVYDGPSTASPLIGAYNSGTDPVGFFVQASWNNPSGCLTLRFHSDAANEGTGWVANVACGDPPQPIIPHIEAYKNGVGPNIMNPIDTGYVDLCPGDSVLLKALPSFPNSLENANTGYSQSNANCIFTWTIGGVGQVTGDQIWFTPPTPNGYYIDLGITDIFPHTVHSNFKVRVSIPPIFAGTGPVEDSVCLGLNTQLIGGVTQQDTVGVNIPGGEFQVGGAFAGITFLPDGAGQSYQTSVPISGFDTTAVITSSADIDQICLDIEHSYIGDIEIALTCPNGTTVSLLNAYNQTPFGWNELVPGGCGNGISTFLGNDTNLDGGAPGSPVWSYCFSPTNATLGTMCNEEAANNTIPNDYNSAGQYLPNGTTGNNISMDTNGVYLPDGNFNDFIGCPINGPWTITVQDNQGIDDGYIFQWGIYFNSSLYPESEGYQNIVISDFWDNDPTIISGQSDTVLIVQPNQIGNYQYTYNVTDNFGCNYDTTVAFVVLPLANIFEDTIACNQYFQVSGTTAFNGGVWSAADTAIGFSNTTSNNPIIVTSTPGIYEVVFTDNQCNFSDTGRIEFPPPIYVQVLDTVICENANFELNPLTMNAGVLQAGYYPVYYFQWEDGSTDSIRIINQPGNYIATVSNYCYTYSDTATIGVKACEITAPNIVVLSSQNGNNTFFVNYSGLEAFNCVILNRWGNKIYEYTDPAGGWDGRTLGGTLVEEGVYFYKIEATLQGGEDVQLHGFVHLKY